MFKRHTSTRPISTLAFCIALLLIYSVIFQSFPAQGGGLVLAKAGTVTEKRTGESQKAQSSSGEAQRNELKLSAFAAQPSRTPNAPQAPNAPLAAVIVATNRDSFPNHGDGKAHENDAIDYSIAITNTGDTDATGVSFTDVVDGNTSTLVGGATVQFSVIADPSYGALGNDSLDTTTLAPGSGQTVLENDTLNGSALTGFGDTLTNANNVVPNGTNTVTTTNGGTVKMNANGSFTYNPAPGFGGAGVTDTFWYTLTKNTVGTGNPNGFPRGSARVTITVSTPIWFINSAAAVGGNGTLASPFNCYTGTSNGAQTCFSDTAADDPGDPIFLYNGGYIGGYALLANQKLIGQGSTASLASLTGATVPPGNTALPATNGNPANVTITTAVAATNAIPVSAGGILLRGFTVGNTTGAKIFGSSFGTLTVGDSVSPDVGLSGTGQALNLTTGTLAGTSAFSSVTTTSSTTSGLTLTGVGGTVAFGSTTVSGNNNECLVISNSAANINFGNTSCTGGGNGVSISGAAGGTRTFGTLGVSGGSGNAYVQSGGGGNVTVNGAATLSSGAPDTIVIQNANGNTINFAGGATVTHTGTGGNGVQWSGTNSGSTLTFESLAVTTSNGTGINLAGGGTVTVTNGTKAISATGVGAQTAPAILANTVALNANFSNVSCNGSGTGGNCVSLTTVTGTSNFGGGSLTGAAGATFFVSGGSPTVTYSGSITQNNAARVVDIQNTTANTITFTTGTITGGASSTGVNINGVNGNVSFANLNLGTSGSRTANQAVTITNGTGTYSLGAISIFTNNVSGLVATNADGTLNNTSGTVNSTNATAINIDGPAGLTTLGMTLTSVSSSSATTNGILVQDTNGSFTINGSGSAGTGGTIQNSVQRGARFNNATNISLSWIDFTGNGTANLDTSAICGDIKNGTNTNCAAGIDMQTVSTASLTGVHISNGIQVGLNGRGVTDLTLTNVEVNNAGNETNECGIQMSNLFGTMTWSGLNIHDNASRQLNIQNSTTPAVNLTINSSTFANTSWPGSSTSAQGILFSGSSTANMTISVQNTTIARNFGPAVQSDSSTGATTSTTFNGGSLIDNGQHFVIASTGSGNMTYNLTNVATAWVDPAHTAVTPISIFLGSPSSGNFTGTISGNIFGLAATANSASPCLGCNVMVINNSQSSGHEQATITNNTIQHSGGGGIDVVAGGGGDTSTMKVKIENNTLKLPDGNGTGLPITVVNTTVVGDTSSTCANILNNSISGTGGTGTWNIANAIRLRNPIATAGPYTLPSYAGAATDYAAIVAYLNGRNTITGGNSSVQNVGSYGGGADCFLMLALGGIIKSDNALFSRMYGLDPFLTENLTGVAMNGPISPETNLVSLVSVPSLSTSLRQEQLDFIASAAIDRWTATGLTPQQAATLRGIKFGVSDLSGAYLGEADGNRIQVDRNADGKGWFVDPNPKSDSSFAQAVSATRRYTDPMSAPAGHIDLLTAIEHEMGHRLGLDDSYAAKDRDSIMYGYLTVGERRIPSPNQARNAHADALSGSHFLTLSTGKREAKTNHAVGRARSDQQPLTPQSGGTVGPVALGTVTAGSSVVLTFQVTINTKAPLGAVTISNQGQVSGTNFATVNGVPTTQPNTDDPDIAGAANPTITPIVHPSAADGAVTGRIVDSNGVPVEGAVVRLDGTQNRKFITDANGVYRFENVETSGFYTVTPSRVNYTFSPASRSFSQIGESTEAAFGATLSSSNLENPLDTPEYFVRQHYLDFLGREPDEAGFNFWSDQIIECGNDNQCIERRRENVSAAYFLSIEFQKTGGLVDGLYRASYGVRPNFSEFMPDTRAVGLGVQVGKPGWEALLAANKEAFINAFVNRPAFHAVYDGMDNSLFVDTLIGHTGVSFTSGERDALVSGLANGTQTRSDVLRSIAEDNRFVNAKFNEAFVMMEYFGYLRRDADAGGYGFWLNKLNEFNGNFERAEMVKAFIVSGEYRDRFPR